MAATGLTASGRRRTGGGRLEEERTHGRDPVADPRRRRHHRHPVLL